MRSAGRILACVAATALGCSASAPSERRTVLMQSAPRPVVLLPMNVPVPVPRGHEEAAERLWDELHRYLDAHGTRQKTLSEDTARRLWLASLRRARAADPDAGLPETMRHFVGELARHAEFGNVLLPVLVARSAVVDGLVAHWDDTTAPIEIDAGSWAGMIDEETPFGGKLPALSLEMLVLDAEGEVVQRKRRGLALLGRVRVLGAPEEGAPRFEMLDREAPLGDREANLRGIARALAPFVSELPPSAVLEGSGEPAE